MTTEQIQILRKFASVILCSLGVYIAFTAYGVLLLGPHLLYVELILAAVVTAGYLLFRAGNALK